MGKIAYFWSQGDEGDDEEGGRISVMAPRQIADLFDVAGTRWTPNGRRTIGGARRVVVADGGREMGRSC